MKDLIFYVDCLLLVAVPLVFILHGVYKDGVLGRAALAGILLAAATFLMERGEGVEHAVSGQFLLLTTSFTGFLCWHLWRFHSRILRQRSGVPPPRYPADCPILERDVREEQGDRSRMVQGPGS